ncbi:MAG: hypothetical protein Q9221_006416 [Calogaya cf. arnoldii]
MYLYHPLDEQCIRVLTVLPGPFGSNIHINLSHVRLEPDDPPPYEALSYTWSGNILSHLVYVDTEDGQQSLPVTENLYTALQHIRDGSLPRILWVDAVCINQRHDEERGQQVARMADIYKSAAKVIIWLGPEANSSKAATEALRILASKLHIDWTNHNISAASEEDAKWLDLTKTKYAPLFDEKTWVSIAWLLNRPWFSRLWIWQEVFLARNGAKVICGDDTISWEDLCKAIYALFLQLKPEHIQGLKKSVDRAAQIVLMDDRLSLKEILERTKDAQCSDQRDKIYGLLNLVAESQKFGIQPDYTKTTVEVFRDLMLTSIFEYHDLTFLSRCGLQDERGKLPSWVPDWSVPNKYSMIRAASASTNAPAQARYNDGDRCLIATGRHMGKIAEVQQILTHDLAGIVDASSLRITCAALARLTSWLRNQMANDTFDSQLEIICRTLCCNDFSDIVEPPNKRSLDCQATLVQFRILTDLMAEPTDDFLESCAMFFAVFYDNSLGRSCVVTDEGYVGVAPNTAHQGDSIVVLLGCESPMVLRPREDAHLVIGEVYVHGLMAGEAFLGPLPRNWQFVFRYEEITEEQCHTFVARGQNVWQVEDPRLGPLPEGWAEEKHPRQHLVAIYRNIKEDCTTEWDPRMMLPALRARNVELRVFKMI